MKKLNVVMLSTFVSIAFTGCNSVVDTNQINDEGNLVSKDLKWPAIEEASLEGGTFPSQDEIDLLQKNLTRSQLKKIIEHPHFQERFRAKEWNYLFNFNMSDGSIKQCQLKILFDKNYRAQNYYLKPADCLHEKLNLSADMLFEFDKSGFNDIRPEGKKELEKLANYVLKEGNKAQLSLIGHTDYMGSDDYNQKLSERRAATIGDYLITQGVNPKNITTAGRGEKEPIKQCDKKLEKTRLKECLITNRRVSVEIKRYSKHKIVWHDINMTYSELRNK
ncbi:Outer membrane protein II* [Phocoenobacter uteri]|uniref:Outer membrane protein II n=1 Tax=Phocoenobacter uteri TaxID=146806 RepID=A0A379CB95_9PAST|nr:OmpA family protein [Phocoenobacter uteri]MDG6881494.1 hypothetical protein [Phocoenobacter uteri]SUB59524.1 Outer membrane protein II* [Phocoenobacter uteri]